ncbi:hypothetical protein DAPPUDRAFT_303139 [Daphnia pulex]|uniref:Uncharacterized protein n=1 Tax=Daphnia pulex TaxID=6669 RepID=E9FSZ1_DAPPU|nr:hypothetical protein DAPPUDRAFT_303139 [Daphnia pulex]|eukprot:EFX89732.1 hypothetical protein DAPPUDRAFT_303139 [Daphnia pulex]
MNSIILLLTLTVAYSQATHTNYGSSKSSTTSYAAPAVTILKQINQLNEDGSYTFGYEASDGSFRVENMDANGYLTGRYGYVDSYGETQETEYAAGKMSGQSVGFQARGSLIPEESRSSAQPFPFVRSATTKSVEQKAFDYLYTSVDDDEDGFPDSAPVRTAEVVRLSSPTQISYDSAPTIVRVADPYDASVSNIRTVTPVRNNNYNSGAVRLSLPTKVSSAVPTVVRVADPYAPTISDVRAAVTVDRSNYEDVRLVSPAKKSYVTGVSDVRVLSPTKTSTETVRLAAPSRSSYGSTKTVVRVVDQSDDGYGKVEDDRVAPAPAVTRVSYEKAPAVVRVVNREKAAYDTIVKQTIEQPIVVGKTVSQISEVSVPVFRSQGPSYGSSAVRSTGRLDEFLKSLKKSNRNSGNSYNSYGSSAATFVNQDQFVQPTQDFQVVQDDASSVSIDSVGFSRII